MEEADLIGDVASEGHLVRGDEHRHTALLQLAHDLEHLADEFWVEGAGDLVEQQRARARGDRADQRDALLLAAGQLVWVVALAIGEAKARQ